MLKKEELRAKNFKIYLGMPMYGGLVTESTLHGLLNLQNWSTAAGVNLRFQTIGNESLITRARNTIVSMMLDSKDFAATHLLFIDADIGFNAENIERLLCFDKDLVCGIYPRKHIHFERMKGIVNDFPNATPEEIEMRSLGYNINFDNTKGISMEHGFCRVNEAATGMMLVKREVFRKMIKKFPERKYDTDQIINGRPYRSNNCYDLFAVGPYQTGDQKRYLSEDYYFSRLWQECGGEIWADMTMPLTHFGNKAFRGHVGALLKTQDELENKWDKINQGV